MATNQKKKSGSGNRSRSNSNNKKSNSRSNSSRSNSRSKQQGSGGDGLTKLMLFLLCALIVVLLVINLTKEKENTEEPTPTPYPTMELTPSVAPTEKPENTPTPEPTKKPENTPTEAPTPEPTDIPDIPEADVSIAEADGLMKQVVNVEGYSFEMSDDHLRIDEHVYYSYVILYNGAEEDYVVLVDRADGSMFYYNEKGRQPLEFFPMDWKETPDTGNEAMTVERAEKWLSAISYTSMALPAPLSDCTLELDAWKTVVSGVECYCLNVFYQGTLAGTIYFTDEAEQVYYLDEFGEFIRVQ